MSLWNAAAGVVMQYKIHPILVNFTAALVPVSLAGDALGRWNGDDALTKTGAWTLFCAGAVTPLTALTGWLFWMSDDVGSRGMMIHKWLGTALALLVPALALWRARYYRRDRRLGALYLAAAALVVAALVYQGSLGGAQVFKDM